MPRDKLTHEMMRDPQIGDRFTELRTFWVYVVGRNGNTVYTLEASAPCQFPEDGELKTQTVGEFKRRFSYAGSPGYWIKAVDRGNDVTGWHEAKSVNLVSAPKQGEDDEES